MAGAVDRIGCSARTSHTVCSCSVTFPKKVAERSEFGSVLSPMAYVKVPGCIWSANSPTSVMPSELKVSPRPCQMTSGNGVSSSASSVVWRENFQPRVRLASRAVAKREVVARIVREGLEKKSIEYS